MEHRHQARPGLRKFRPGQQIAGQMCSRKVPAVITSPCLITPPKHKAPGHSDPVKRWNFCKADWKRFAFSQMNLLRDCHLQTHQTLRGHTRIFARTYYLRPNNASHVAVRKTMCHAGKKSVRPSIAPSPKPQWGSTLIEPLCSYYLGSAKRSRSDGRNLTQLCRLFAL